MSAAPGQKPEGVAENRLVTPERRRLVSSLDHSFLFQMFPKMHQNMVDTSLKAEFKDHTHGRDPAKARAIDAWGPDHLVPFDCGNDPNVVAGWLFQAATGYQFYCSSSLPTRVLSLCAVCSNLKYRAKRIGLHTFVLLMAENRGLGFIVAHRWRTGPASWLRWPLADSPGGRGALKSWYGSRALRAQYVIVQSNVPPNILEKVRAPPTEKLHNRLHHPLCTLRKIIESYFDNELGVKQGRGPLHFAKFIDLPPIVSTRACFDELLVESTHPSRRPTDTYYLDATTVLRAHTTAHDTELLRQGYRAFLVSGDVYRRDSIDKKHYPIFHQMDGVRVFDGAPPEAWVLDDLKDTLYGLAQYLFGRPRHSAEKSSNGDASASDANAEPVPVRWVDAEFPFTRHSLELEVFWQGDWLEVLGCGVIQPDVLRAGNVDPKEHTGWAFGLGLERLAMVLFGVPDIRLFWSSDPRFIRQFQDGKITGFQPYSKYPPVYKDVSMWVKDAPAADGSSDGLNGRFFHENDLCELVRGIAGDLVEDISRVDEFVHPKTKRHSICYRITYRSPDRSLTDEEINHIQRRVRECIQEEMHDVAELR
jgi:phenylalanyl-tRNA synthetase alpha chain